MERIRLESLHAEIATLSPTRRIGRVEATGRGTVEVSGLTDAAAVGDLVELRRLGGTACFGEVLRLAQAHVTVLCDGGGEGICLRDPVALLGPSEIAPDRAWIGRVVDPFGRALDGRPILRGPTSRPLRAAPPAPAARRALGPRLETGTAVFNTLLPIVRGQRIGLFAGSGVGKTMLLGRLAQGIEADVVVIALIGERGRELRDFVERVLGPEGMKRAVVVAATSDTSPLVRRRAAWTAMSVAEHFRDEGNQVLLVADSLTRFADAHREVALAAGEPGALRGYPPSTAQTIMELAERAGPGAGTLGDITAIFSVLVAGSDMEEPVADIVRGVLDGHAVLDRAIAERGRFPAIDVLRSVSRSLPDAATPHENALIARARHLLGAYDNAEMMIKAGLYTAGSDAGIDAAIRAWPKLDAFVSASGADGVAANFVELEAALAAPEESAAPAQ